MPSQFSVSSSPVTTAGTLGVTWGSQTANYILAAPNGSSGTPTFRQMVAPDLAGSAGSSKYLTSDGTNLSWGTITPGTNYWAEQSGYLTPGNNVSSTNDSVSVTSSYCISGNRVLANYGSGNISVGQGASIAGSNNTYIGYNSGNLISGSSNIIDNTFIGNSAGYSTTTDSKYNTFIGYKASYNNTAGYGNTSVGDSAGYTMNGTPNDNTFIGHLAGFSTTSGYNTFLGAQAGYLTGSSPQNTAIGYKAGYYNTGQKGVFIGTNSGPSSSTDASNLLYINNAAGTPLIYGDFANDRVGINKIASTYTLEVNGTAQMSGIQVTTSPVSGYVLTCSDASGTGQWQASSGGNVPAGTDQQTLRYNGTTLTANSALYNDGTNVGTGGSYYIGGTTVATGTRVLYSISSTPYNTFCGAGTGTNSGTYNTFVGSNAGAANTGATYNTAVGSFAGNALNGNSSYGDYNTLVGAYAGSHVTSTGSNGGNNTFLGYGSGGSITTGGQNTLIGMFAGLNFTGTEASNVVIGYNATPPAGTSNKLWITNGQNNTNPLISGIFNATASNQYVGINTTGSPTHTLEVNGTAQMTGFQLGTTATNGYVLTTNASGVGTWQAPTGGTNYWQETSGYLTPGNNASSTNDSVSVTSSYCIGGNRILANYGSSNIFVGVGASVSGTNNTLLGYNAGNNNSGNYNVLLGNTAGSLNGGSGYNVYVGAGAGNGGSSTVGYNICVGTNSGVLAAPGGFDTYIGYQAGAYGKGLSNVMIGRSAGYGSSSTTNASVRNTFVGDSSGLAITTGTDNACLGYSAGNAITTGTYNVCIGSNSGGPSTGSQQLWIYSGGSAPAAPLIYGDFANKRVGIGMTSPATSFAVNNLASTSSSYNYVLVNTATGDFYSGGTATGGGAPLWTRASACLSPATAGDSVNTTSYYCINGYKLVSTPATTVNISVGTLAGNATGTYNTFLGYSAGTSATGSNNTIMGANAGTNATSGSNICVGYQAGAGVGTTNSGGSGTFVGYQAGEYNGNSPNNTFVGYQSGLGSSSSFITGGGLNTFVGYNTGGNSITTAAYNTLVGANVCGNNALISGNSNTCLGYASGYSNSGSYNTFVGLSAGRLNSSGGCNTYLGDSAGYTATTAKNCVALGWKAGLTNTAQSCTFVGASAGGNNSTTAYSTFIGDSAGYQSQAPGNNCTFVGFWAGAGGGYALSDNTYIGYQAGVIAANNGGNYNTYVGSQAGYHYSSTTQPYNNTFIGYLAGGGSSNAGSGNNNTFLGYEAGELSTSANLNTFIGAYAGGTATNTGGVNTCVGAYAGKALAGGNNNVFIGTSGTNTGTGSGVTSGVGNIFIGGNPGTSPVSNPSHIFSVSAPDAGNSFLLFGGLASPYWLGVGGYSAQQGTNILCVNGTICASSATVATCSDRRIKTDIHTIDGDSALETLNKLRPVKFRYTEEYKKTHNGIGDQYYSYFIAQEYQKVFPNSIDSTKEGILMINTGDVMPYLTAAVQKLSKKVQEQEEEINSLKQRAYGSSAVSFTGNTPEQQEINTLKEEIRQLKEEIYKEKGTNSGSVENQVHNPTLAGRIMKNAPGSLAFAFCFLGLSIAGIMIRKRL